MSNYLVLTILSFLLFVERRNKPLAILLLWYMGVSVLNLIYYPKGAFFFVFHAWVALFMISRVASARRKLNNNKHLSLLDIILTSHILLNLIGIFDYWWFNSEIEYNYNLLMYGNTVLTVLELMVLLDLTRYGITKFVGAVSDHIFRSIHHFQGTIGYVQELKK